MSEHEEQPPAKIKVTDRRLFDRDGNFREDVSAESGQSETEPATEATERPAPAEPTGESRAADPAAEFAPAPDTTTSPEVADDGEPDAATEPAAVFAEEALMRFIEEQYIGGLLALGAMPEPQTGQVMEDLDLAQVRIEVLGLLREHAAASLSLEARKGIDDVIYQLRMAYLQKRKVVKL